MKNVYRQIMHHEKELTNLEHGVAEYFISKQPAISLRQLSSKIHLSPATISRFVRKIEFDSYEEFLEAYEFMLNEEKLNGPSSIYEMHTKTISRNHDLITNSSIDSLIQRLLGRRILVVAFEDTAFACMDFVNRLKRLGIDAHIATTKQTVLLETNFLGEDDVIIVVSISGYNEILTEFIRKQRKLNKYIFGISTENTQMIQACSEHIVLYFNSTSVMSFDYSYALPLIVLFDYIFINLKQNSKGTSNLSSLTHDIIS